MIFSTAAKVRLAVIVLGSPILYAMWGTNTIMWLHTHCKKSEIFLSFVANELRQNRNVRASRRIIEMMVALPEELLNSNKYLMIFFGGNDLGGGNVKRGLQLCLSALKTCLNPRI